METIYLLLGANLGNPLQQLNLAIEELNAAFGEFVVKSSIYESEAWGVTDQPNFYNQVVVIQTDKSPEEILSIIQKIEVKLGRVRETKWGARLIDIDILYFGTQIVKSSNLTIPHPYIQDRKFTLLPLVEIAPTFKHPNLSLTNKQMLEVCQDNLSVNLYINE